MAQFPTVTDTLYSSQGWDLCSSVILHSI